MKYDKRKIAGSLLFIGGVIGVLGIIVAEALYPGYSTSDNYISDLGVGPSALVFNSSMVILGVLVLCGAYFIQKAFNFKLLTILVAVAGIGAIGVGLFTEDAGTAHLIFSFLILFFGGLSATASYKVQKAPASYFSVILGAMSLLAIALFASGTLLDLGKGGMERMIAYPSLLWLVVFGGYLIGCSNETSTAKKS